MKPGTLRPLPARSFDYRQAQHLLNRAGFGGTPAQVRGLAGLGVEGAIEHVVDFRDAGALAAASGGFDRNIMSPPDEAERKKVVADVQKMVAKYVFYVFPPAAYSTQGQQPYVKNYRPKSGYNVGAVVRNVWIDKG